jgi:hypothetical protein
MNKKGFFLIDFIIAVSIYSFFILTLTICFQIYAKNFNNENIFLADFEKTQNTLEGFLAGEVSENIKIESYSQNINKIILIINKNKKIELLYEKK